jgi:cytochrome c oxidase cbb3-type subunit 4
VHYDQLRHFADSWALLLLTLFFVGVIAWVLRPGARKAYDEQAEIPFRHDEKE